MGSSGYYRNRETHRCSHCNENCKSCTGLLECYMCKPDTADFTYVIQQSSGKCQAIPNHLFKQYRWWCVGLGILLLFLILIGCAGLCTFCCSGNSSKAKGMVRTYDSDDEDEFPANHAGRKLGRY